MTYHIEPAHQFTTVNLIDINQASAKHIPVLLAQVVLDAGIEALESLDVHTCPQDLAVLAEYQLYSDHDNFHKLLHIVKLACAAESRLTKLVA